MAVEMVTLYRENDVSILVDLFRWKWKFYVGLLKK